MRMLRTDLVLLSMAFLLGHCAVESERAPDTIRDAGTLHDATKTVENPEKEEPKAPHYVGEIPEGSTGVANDDAGKGSESTSIAGPALLADALDTVNHRIDAESLLMKHVSPEEVKAWFEDGKYFQWPKSERKALEQTLSSGQIGDGWTLGFEQQTWTSGMPWQLTLCSPMQEDQMGVGYESCGTIAVGNEMFLYTEQSRTVCQDQNHALCDELFAGAMPSLESVELAPEVMVRVQPIAVPGQPLVPELAQPDALDVSVQLSPTSIPAIVDYFAVGYDRSALEGRLRELLGAESSKWVRVQDFFFGWVRERANTFPARDDNEVCHGPARQFYNDTLHNGPGDSSTEATALLLHDHYCLVGDDIAPRFGDYLYKATSHSARYVLKDPATGRDVVFSVQSGGSSAYRFWWADEDMSGKPFAHQPMADYRQKLIDVWRRCR